MGTLISALDAFSILMKRGEKERTAPDAELTTQSPPALPASAPIAELEIRPSSSGDLMRPRSQVARCARYSTI